MLDLDETHMDAPPWLEAFTTLAEELPPGDVIAFFKILNSPCTAE